MIIYINKLNSAVLIVPAIFIIFLYIAIMTAWISDDSLITLKQILNTINFHEISWRYGERVQGFTHPTWFLFLLPLVGLTREIFLTTIITSIILSIFSIAFIYEYTRDLVNRKLPIYFLFSICILLSLSKAFTDFMTSGLENCLSYFLIGFIICTTYDVYKKINKLDVVLLYIAFALAILNRLDYIPLLSPLALYTFFRHVGFKNFLLLVPGCLLLLTWFTFAIIYFGMPFANTMLAKLGAGYPLIQYIKHGYDYFLVTFYKDPMTITLITLGVIAGFSNKNDFNVINRALSFGIINYLLYILLSGGDFMLGRFFAVLAYVSIFNIIAIFSGYNHKRFYIVTYASIFIILPFSSAPIFSYINYQDYAWDRGVANERGWYYQQYGWLAENRKEWPVLPAEQQDLVKKTEYRKICGAAGATALLNPNILWLDECALADPFLSQLPGTADPNWRTGHILRKIPTNYGEFLLGQTDRIADPQLQPLLDDVILITKGPIFTKERFKAIWRFNISRPYIYDYVKYSQDSIPLTNTSKERIYPISVNAIPLIDGTAWDIPVATIIMDKLTIDVQNIQAAGMELSLDCNDVYSVTVNDNLVYTIRSAVEKVPNGGLVTHAIKFDQPITINKIVVSAISGDNNYSLGHLLLKDVGNSCEHVTR